jgi:hypothetical protein
VGSNIQQNSTKTNCFRFGFGDGRKWQRPGASPLEAERWQHEAVVRDGKNSVLYANRRETIRGPVAPNSGQNVKLGQGQHSGRYFHILLRDVRICRQALSPTVEQSA